MKLCACGCKRRLPNERFNYLPFHKKRLEPKPEPVPVDPTLKQNCQTCGCPDELDAEGCCYRCHSQKQRVSDTRDKWFGEIPIPLDPFPTDPEDEEENEVLVA